MDMITSIIHRVDVLHRRFDRGMPRQAFDRVDGCPCLRQPCAERMPKAVKRGVGLLRKDVALQLQEVVRDRVDVNRRRGLVEEEDVSVAVLGHDPGKHHQPSGDA